ncbi:MAG: Tm-1-like ATP-binding domain-containing protein [Blastococcus sp.]
MTGPATDRTVVLVGTLDTKGDEYAFLRARLEQAGVPVLVVDVGTAGAAAHAARRDPRRRGRRRRLRPHCRRRRG